MDEVARRASGMSVVRIGEVGDRTSERQTVEVYGTGLQRGVWPG